MKRYGWLFEKAFTKENISLAITKASKGKRKRKDVSRVLENKDYYVEQIYEMVWNGKYKPNSYCKKEIIDGLSGKVRTLSKPQFYPDHIIHWCIYIVLYPILERSMIHNSCASMKKRGQVYGKNVCMKMLKNKKKTKYYLKIDIKKYYPSIDVKKLRILLSRKIKDPKLLKIIDDVLALDEGLPIGMILSQLFANFNLYQIDHEYDKHGYVRYADDIVIFGSSKRTLHKLRIELNNMLNDNGLRMKDNWQIYKTDKEMLDFMGYRMDHNKIIMRKKIMYRFTKRIRRYSKNKSHRNASAIVSYMGWVKNSNSWQFYNNRVKPYVDFFEVKKIIKGETEC